MTTKNRAELIKMLNESHERFIQGIVAEDGALAMLAYRNYVEALAQVLHGIQFPRPSAFTFD